MAQSIILKRSAVSGKVPTTSSLSIGEVAINTYDGRLFLHVSRSGSETIEHIVTTNSITTGSVNITQTGSFGELVVTQDGNFNRDIYVTNDIVGNGDLDIGGTLTASLQQGYIWVGNGGNHTKAIPTSSLVGTTTDITYLNSFTQSYYTDSASFNTRINNVTTAPGTISGSAQITAFGFVSGSYETTGRGILSSSAIDFDTYTSSIDTFTTEINNYTQSSNDRLNNLELVSGTFATTGSNTFVGDQNISGSVYITNDLVIYGSSSIVNISASIVDIGANQLTLNTFTPTVRFGGISVIDSGSTGGTGSLWWDSERDHWLYEHPAPTSASYKSAILISGPKNTDGLGTEIGLTPGQLTVAVGDDHISSSQISDDGQTVSIIGNLVITGSFTSSLQQGYFLVGDENNRAKAIASSSFVPLLQKAGAISGSAFTGVLRKSTVTFTTPFPDINYSVTVTSEAARVFTIESKTSGSFTINSNTRAPMSGLTYWIAMAYGETTQ